MGRGGLGARATLCSFSTHQPVDERQFITGVFCRLGGHFLDIVACNVSRNGNMELSLRSMTFFRNLQHLFFEEHRLPAGKVENVIVASHPGKGCIATT